MAVNQNQSDNYKNHFFYNNKPNVYMILSYQIMPKLCINSIMNNIVNIKLYLSNIIKQHVGLNVKK